MSKRERLINSIKKSFSGRLTVAASEVLAPVVADRLIADGVILADHSTEKGGVE
ncbi:MAG: hypothetical protein IJ300_12415 [Clostridia bacterium]|nr:hypothetical protein [Clostridia bacterium]MBQ8765339.1 hypothetical protein [Clostridia bacterium]